MHPSETSWLLALLALSGGVAAQEATEQEAAEAAAEKTPAERVQAVIDDYDEAYGAFVEAYRAAETDEERSAVYEELYPEPSGYAERLWAIADEHAGTDAALDALTWIARNGPQRDDVHRVLEAVVAHHVDDAQVGRIVEFVYVLDGETLDLVEEILASSPHEDVQGQACLAIAQYWKRSADSGGGDEALAKAEELFEVLIAEYPDVAGRRGTMKETAERALFEIRNLAIGMVAPEIEGEDIDGVPFKLSDYRGKVVVLDFWGDW